MENTDNDEVVLEFFNDDIFLDYMAWQDEQGGSESLRIDFESEDVE